VTQGLRERREKKGNISHQKGEKHRPMGHGKPEPISKGERQGTEKGGNAETFDLGGGEERGDTREKVPSWPGKDLVATEKKGKQGCIRNEGSLKKTV